MPRRATTRAILGAGALCVAITAHGAEFTVSNTTDTGTGSLRQAVIDANDSTDASNEIVFTTFAAGSTITLATPLENISSATLIFDATATPGLVINGPGTSAFLTFTTTSTSAQFHANSTFADGILTFDEDDSGAIAGTLNGGNLQLIKTGAGTTTLTAGSVIDLSGATSKVSLDEGTFVVNGDLSAGAVNVNQGTFVMNGTLSSATLLLASPATLTGNTSIGAISAGTTTVQGRLAPSGTIGVLGFDGAVQFGSTSVLDMDVQPGGGDLIDVTGGAVTVASGAQIIFRANPSDFSVPTSVTVLSADSGLSGTFTLVSNDYAFLDTALVTDADSVDIQFTPNGRTLSSFAATPNQRAVAQLLEDASAGATGDLADVITGIQSSTAGEMPVLLDAIGGESLTAFATARQVLAERTARALHRRARDPAWGQGRAFYLAPDVVQQGDERPLIDRVRPGVWVDGLGLYGELDGDTGEAEVDTLLYGGTLGGDAWIADHFLVGLAAGYARSDVDLDGREADVFGDTVQGALYAGWSDPRGFVSGYGRYAYTYQTSDRRIESSGILRKAHAQWDANDYGAGAEAGITLVSFGGFALQPIAGVDWLHLSEESYRESDAGSLGLFVDPETLESTAARFGGRVFGRIDMGDVGILAPELRAFYQRLYGDRERVLDARLSGAPGLGVVGVRGPELPRENLLLGLGWGVQVSEYLAVSFDYDAVLGSDRVEHQGNVAARVVF